VQRRGAVLQVACKPNSVEGDHSSRRRITTPLKRPTRRFPAVPASRNRDPSWRAGPARIRSPDLAGGFPPYLVLLRVGFTLPPPLQTARCALTAPFHPYPGRKSEAVCSLWHLPSLSLHAQIPDVIRHTALRSSDFPLPEHLHAPAATARPTCTSMLVDLPDSRAEFGLRLGSSQQPHSSPKSGLEWGTARPARTQTF
jgi:hypothetical protein